MSFKQGKNAAFLVWDAGIYTVKYQYERGRRQTEDHNTGSRASGKQVKAVSK